MKYKASVVIEKDADGFYAYCPELEGCQTQGETLEDVLKNIKDAIALYVSTLSAREKRQLLSREILTSSVEVA